MPVGLPSNAGDVGLIPGQKTKIPHVTGQLHLDTTTTELPPPNFTNEKPEALAAQWLVPGRVAKKDTELAFEPCPLAFIP